MSDNFSTQQVKDFMESTIWKEILATIEERRNIIHTENDSMETPWERVLFNRGGINELRYMINLPAIMLAEANERIENARTETRAEDSGN